MTDKSPDHAMIAAIAAAGVSVDDVQEELDRFRVALQDQRIIAVAKQVTDRPTDDESTE